MFMNHVTSSRASNHLMPHNMIVTLSCFKSLTYGAGLGAPILEKQQKFATNSNFSASILSVAWDVHNKREGKRGL